MTVVVRVLCRRQSGCEIESRPWEKASSSPDPVDRDLKARGDSPLKDTEGKGRRSWEGPGPGQERGMCPPVMGWPAAAGRSLGLHSPRY